MNTCIVATHSCVPSGAQVIGHVRPFERTDQNAGVASATVAITSLKSYVTSMPSDSMGNYSLQPIPPRSLADFNVTVSQPPAPPTLATRVSVSLGAGTSNSVDLPLVSYPWLVDVASRCGLNAGAATVDGHVNYYFTQRSTVVGTLLDNSGKPVSGIGRAAIAVTMAAYSMALWKNTDSNPADLDTSPTRVCFLDVDTTSNQLVGSASPTSTAVGKFVMFRVRNARGTGEGSALVESAGFVSQTVSLQSSANIGIVTLMAGADAVGGEKMRDFTKDVYPLFATYACAGCHSPGNDGVTMSTARGPNMLRLDLSGTPDAVWQALTTGGYAGCDDATTPVPARVCPPSVDASLLLHKPLAEPGGTASDHANSSFQTTSDPNYRIIYEWIKQGAAR